MSSRPPGSRHDPLKHSSITKPPKPGEVTTGSPVPSRARRLSYITEALYPSPKLDDASRHNRVAYDLPPTHDKRRVDAYSPPPPRPDASNDEGVAFDSPPIPLEKKNFKHFPLPPRPTYPSDFMVHNPLGEHESRSKALARMGPNVDHSEHQAPKPSGPPPIPQLHRLHVSTRCQDAESSPHAALIYEKRVKLGAPGPEMPRKPLPDQHDADSDDEHRYPYESRGKTRYTPVTFDTWRAARMSEKRAAVVEQDVKREKVVKDAKMAEKTAAGENYVKSYGYESFDAWRAPRMAVRMAEKTSVAEKDVKREKEVKTAKMAEKAAAVERDFKRKKVVKIATDRPVVSGAPPGEKYAASIQASFQSLKETEGMVVEDLDSLKAVKEMAPVQHQKGSEVSAEKVTGASDAAAKISPAEVLVRSFTQPAISSGENRPGLPPNLQTKHLPETLQQCHPENKSFTSQKQSGPVDESAGKIAPVSVKPSSPTGKLLGANNPLLFPGLQAKRLLENLQQCKDKNRLSRTQKQPRTADKPDRKVRDIFKTADEKDGNVKSISSVLVASPALTARVSTPKKSQPLPYPAGENDPKISTPSQPTTAPHTPAKPLDPAIQADTIPSTPENNQCLTYPASENNHKTPATANEHECSLRANTATEHEVHKSVGPTPAPTTPSKTDTLPKTPTNPTEGFITLLKPKPTPKHTPPSASAYTSKHNLACADGDARRGGESGDGWFTVGKVGCGEGEDGCVDGDGEDEGWCIVPSSSSFSSNDGKGCKAIAVLL